MKRIISLALICVMLTLSLLLTACDIGNDIITDTETKPVTEKQTDTETETEASKEPVPVDSLGGKNPKQLFLQFYDEFSQVSTYDMSALMRTAEGSIFISTKNYSNATYTYMEYDGKKVKLWVMEDVLHIEKNAELQQATQADVDEILSSIENILGESYMELLGENASTLPSKDDLPQSYLDKFENAQLYFDGQLYFCTIDVSDSEAQAMGEPKGYKETIYFDANGKLKKIVDELGTIYICIEITALGNDNVQIHTGSDIRQ